MMNTYYRKYGYQRLGGQLSHSPTRAECQPSARAVRRVKVPFQPRPTALNDDGVGQGHPHPLQAAERQQSLTTPTHSDSI